MKYHTKKRPYKPPGSKPKKSKKLLCFNKCHKKIYSHSDRRQQVCHESVNYIWDILTNKTPVSNRDAIFYKISDFRDLLFRTKDDSIFLIDIDFNDIDREYNNKKKYVETFNLHTFLIEKRKNKYKIYQSYVLKYTMHEWLHGILNKESTCRTDYSFIDKYDLSKKPSHFSNKLYIEILKDKAMYKELNNNNKNLFKHFNSCVKEFGGNNCISKSTVSRFLDLLQNFFNAFNNRNIKKGNYYSRKIFGWDILTDNEKTEEQTYVSPIKHNIRIKVQSSKILCL